MTTNEALIKELREEGYLKSPHIVEAFRAMDRRRFVPKELEASAYVNEPLPLGHGQTISQPLTVAFMMELLEPLPGQKILDVGFGSGWTTAILAHIVGGKGKVYALELIPELYEFGKKNILKFAFSNVACYNRSGLEGLPEEAPFDRILVSAATHKVPESLEEQLGEGGRMVIPIGPPSYRGRCPLRGGEEWWEGLSFNQSIRLIQKTDGALVETDHPGFSFVPLIPHP